MLKSSAKCSGHLVSGNGILFFQIFDCTGQRISSITF
ncbi:hypothetical protein EVA_07161 [gut metagenome]|uniref:Uncharacterized protein n=1 Tax=gut metagenome TaxID=749906 RepID=J9CWV1_9ZZZZ